MNKYAISCVLLLLVSANFLCSQTLDPSLLEKARAAGISQQQIDEALSGQGREIKTNTVQSKGNEVVERAVPKTITPSDTIMVISKGVFGREIFSTQNLTFAPDYNMPTPVGYVLAAGDELIIDVWGASELNTTLKISSEGFINLPGVGLVYLNGLTIDAAEHKIKTSLKKIISGIGDRTQVKVSLGQIRSIKVNIVGEVAVPGTYTLPSLATLFNALYSAGGVNDIGSLRSIRVFRNNKEVSNLDVYDFLLNGKIETNVRLEDNDLIIVSPYKNLVSVTGKVKRERTFELTDNETLGKLLEYAGGTTGDAFKERMQVRRKAGKMYQIYTVQKETYNDFVMLDGDSVIVRPIINEYGNRITIKGAVWQPGDYELCDQTKTLSGLITMAEGLKGNEFSTRGQVTRRKKDFTYEVMAFDVRNIMNGKSDLELQPDDEVYIPTIFDLREGYYLIVKGEVNRPDTLPYADKMTVQDAIMQCGGIKEAASVEKIEVARRIQNQSGYTPRTAEIFTFSITRDLQLSTDAAGFTLMPFDEIIIRSSPGYKIQKSAFINGEVLFEGEYVMASNGERLSDLVTKAGGLTPSAYIMGASLKRKFTGEEKLKVESVLRVARNVSDKDTVALNTLQTEDSYSVGIDLKSALSKPGGTDDVILVSGDQLYIPKYKGVVKVSGAVMYPNAVTYQTGRGLKSYLSDGGGYQSGARKKPYVVYMNGNVASTKSFLGFKNYPKVEPGSEIIVPMKADREGNRMPEFMAIATTAVSLASVVAMLMSVIK